jgi:hypothetical protein
LDENDSKELHLLIEAMQSGLVELFEQLGELRKQLELIPESPYESKPRAYPLFSEVSPPEKNPPDTSSPDVPSEPTIAEPEEGESSSEVAEVSVPVLSEEPEEPDSVEDDMAASSVSAKVNRVLDPIAHELRTGEATAEILLEYLQSAKEYLIDDDERKARVARDMEIVLKFLSARGARGIRPDERDNILKRMNRWKAHLVAYASSPAK